MKKPNKRNPKNSLHHLYVLQYLVRFTSDLENRMALMRRYLDLQKIDAVDIIEFIELRAQIEVAAEIEKSIVLILNMDL